MNKNNSQTIYEKYKNIGILLFCIYIFTTYVANDVVIPSFVNSVSMYAFLGFSALYVLLTGKIRFNTFTVWMLSVMGVSLASMLYSPEKNILGGTYFTLIVNFLLIFFLSQYKPDARSIKKIARAFSYGSLILVVILIATGNIVDNSSSGRLGDELLGNANILANMLVVSCMMSLWLVVYDKCSGFKRAVYIISIIANYYAMFLSGGRKYIIVPIVFLYILLLFKQDRKGKKHMMQYTFLILAIVLLLYVLIMKVPTFYNVIGVRMEDMFALLSGDEANTDYSGQIRIEMIKLAMERWKQNPIIGYGFDSFKYYNRKMTGHFYYSHNNFVELLYNLGIVGFCAYYWIYVKMFFFVKKLKDNIFDSIKAIVIGTLLSFIVFEFTEISMYCTQVVIMLYMVYTFMNNVKIKGDVKNE